MKAIRHTSTLYYYDGPQVVEACDEIGGRYIAVMIEPDETTDRYVVAGTPPELLRQFKVGSIDLRSLLVESSKDEWFIGKCEEENHLSLTPQSGSILPDFLPEPGFILRSTISDSVAVQEAAGRNNFVLEISVDPPETSRDHRIRGETLAKLIIGMQNVIKHACRSAVRTLSQTTQKQIDAATMHALDVVVPSAPGSFTIVFESANLPDLWGSNEIRRGLVKLDELFRNVASLENAVAIVKENRGRLAKSYLQLLKLLVASKTGLRYAWAEPNFSRPEVSSVSLSEAESLVDALSSITDLGEETVHLDGVLQEGDSASGGWRIWIDDGSKKGKTREGRTRQGGPSVAGLTIGARYRFTCMEKTEDSDTFAQEKRTLYLLAYEAID